MQASRHHGRTYPAQVILRAAIEPINGPGERREIEVDVESFALGRTELDDLTPVGWRRLYIVTGPTPTS